MNKIKNLLWIASIVGCLIWCFNSCKEPTYYVAWGVIDRFYPATFLQPERTYYHCKLCNGYCEDYGYWGVEGNTIRVHCEGKSGRHYIMKDY
jgi:hypothetical protein